MKDQPAEIEDKVHRAVALLRAARQISSDETMYLLSLVRMGLHLGIVSQPDLKTVNELFLWTQPAHLQKILKREMAGPERTSARATYVRRRLGAE